MSILVDINIDDDDDDDDLNEDSLLMTTVYRIPPITKEVVMIIIDVDYASIVTQKRIYILGRPLCL